MKKEIKLFATLGFYAGCEGTSKIYELINELLRKRECNEEERKAFNYCVGIGTTCQQDRNFDFWKLYLNMKQRDAETY